jgi:hypothetical protein
MTFLPQNNNFLLEYIFLNFWYLLKDILNYHEMKRDHFLQLVSISVI